MSRYRSVHANVFSSAKRDEPVIMDMDEDEFSQLEQRKRKNSSEENASYNSIEFDNEYEPGDAGIH